MELLAPIFQTAKLCKMECLPPFVTFGTHAISVEQIERHARDYQRLLLALRDDHVDTSQFKPDQPINASLEGVLAEASDAR